jgi:hypothetical protein
MLACWRLANETVIFMVGTELPSLVKRPKEFFAFAAFSSQETQLVK